jgi:hypothetical protein
MASITSLQTSAIKALISKMIAEYVAGGSGGSGGGTGGSTIPLAISTPSIDPVTVNGTYSMQMAGTGPGTLTWTMSPAVPGITLSSSGVLSGTPTTVGVFTTMITLTSNSGASTSREYKITVNPAPVVTQWVTYASDNGTGSNVMDVTGRDTDNAYGGNVKKYQSTAANVYGIANNDITASGTGTGSVLIPSTSDTVEVEVLVKAMPNTIAITQLISIELSRSTELATNVNLYRMRLYNSGNLAITKLTNGVESSEALSTSEASSFKVGDKIVFRRTMNAAKTVAYLSIRVNDVEVASWIDNSPIAAGSYISFTSGGRTVAYDYWIIRTMNTPTSANAPVLAAATLNLTKDSPVDFQFAASGDPTITYSVISGLPAGLSLSNSGRLTGIPTVTGAQTLVIRATNSVGTNDRTYNFTIAAPGSTGGGVVGVYGATGTNWPASTPRLTDAFDKTYTVAPTWNAVGTAIQDALATAGTSAKVKIEVTPGQFPTGNGAGSSSVGVLQDIGSIDRTWNIVITPRDGVGSVTTAAGSGSAFVNVKGLSIIGIDFSDCALLIRNSSRTYITHTFARHGNFTANGGTGLNDCEYVECVFGPDVYVSEVDRCAVRTANGFSATRSGWRGCYFAPCYKINGATGHCDTIQLSASGSSPNIGTKIINSVVFCSSNQGFIATETPHAQQVIVDTSLFVAGQSRQGYRYPQSSDMYQSTQAYAFVGGAVDITMKKSIVLGKVSSNHTFTLVENTKVIDNPGAPVASGSFTVDPSLATIPSSDIDAMAPYPAVSRQRALWASQFRKVVA